MQRATDNKLILVTRPTRLAELVVRFNTVSQARFYVEHQGADFQDYLREDETYHHALVDAQASLSQLGRVQTVDRAFLPNFVFAPEDTLITLGQDGLVANTLKYLNGQPVIGVNPDPQRWDGKLLPFRVADLPKIVPEVFAGRRSTKSVTMAKASLNNGQSIHAVNDLFIGPQSHVSARYVIRSGKASEAHSSSGVIVSTGLGSTGWLKSLLTGAAAISHAASQDLNGHSIRGEENQNPKKSGTRRMHGARDVLARSRADCKQTTGISCAGSAFGPAASRDVSRSVQAQDEPTASCPVETSAGFVACYEHATKGVTWDSNFLFFTVREPFPTRTTSANLVFGRVTSESPLILESQMAEGGIIFSDGIEKDFLEFNSGTKAVIGVAERKGLLVI